MKTVTIRKLTCQRCGHEWVPRAERVYQCPRCKSAKWDVPREKKERATAR